MRLFLIGGTGRTGQLVLKRALDLGHDVTALVRARSGLPGQGRLTLVEGSALDSGLIARTLPGHDAVISILGRRSRRDDTLLRDGAAALIDGARNSGVRRYLVVSQGLHFATRNPLILVLKCVFTSELADSGAMERRVQASNLDWTIVRAPRLLDGGSAVGYRVERDRRPPGPLSMQRADLAAFLVDEVRRGDHIRAVVGIAAR